MILSLAPMEGLTGPVFRKVHAECFGGFDRYYTPFVTPPHVGYPFNKRSYREVNPSSNEGLNVIPQVLTKHADEFLWAAQLLADLGYQEVNLNLGCPSGTVASKGKGAGFLGNLEGLEAFLQEICEQSPLPVSVKTRLGIASDAEYEQVLELYRHFPLAELIVHPRVQKDGYQGKARWEPYGATLEAAPFPVAFNGDIFTPAAFDALVTSFPETRHVMIGRGILTNPALARMIKGGPAATAAELEHFHDKLFTTYESSIGGNAVSCLKEWWFYAKFAFEDPLAVQRAIRKTKKIDDYLSAVQRVFRQEPLTESAVFRPASKL